MRKNYLTDNLHLLTLWAFAIAPLYNLLGQQAEFFVANRIEPLVIILFLFILGFLSPLLLVVLKELSGLLGDQVKNIVDFVLTTLLGFLAVSSFTAKIEAAPAMVILLCTITAAILLTLAYRRIPPVGSFVRVLSPAALVFPMLFLFFSNVTPLIWAHPEAQPPVNLSAATTAQLQTPVVMIVFDELPLTSLLDEKGQIDAVRYPGFASIAQGSTWFRGLHTVADNTIRAVPAILTGRYPVARQSTPEEASNNIFTLLGSTHKMHISEKHSQLCPPYICKRKSKPFKSLSKLLKDSNLVYLHLISPAEFRATLPDISQNWGDFDSGAPHHTVAPAKQAAQTAKTANLPKPINQSRHEGGHNHRIRLFRRFINRIVPQKQGEKPPFYFIHILLPHAPYIFLPSGKYYGEDRIGPDIPITWGNDERQLTHHYQRHLLQLSTVDRLLQELTAKLKTSGLYEDGMIIVTADHGLSSRAGQPRRNIEYGNRQDILPVPLLIKMPHQNQPQVVAKTMRTIDILPTIADMLKLKTGPGVQGQSVLGNDFPQLKTVSVLTEKRTTQQVSFPVVQWKEVLQAVKEKARYFHTGSQAHLFSLDTSYANQIGVPMPQTRSQAGWRYRLDFAEDYAQIDLKDDFVPSLISGQVSSKNQSLPDDLVIAVNGKRWASAPVLERKDKELYFYAMVPEEAFKQGNNEVQVFGRIKQLPKVLFELSQTE